MLEKESSLAEFPSFPDLQQGPPSLLFGRTKSELEAPSAAFAVSPLLVCNLHHKPRRGGPAAQVVDSGPDKNHGERSTACREVTSPPTRANRSARPRRSRRATRSAVCRKRR